MINYYIYNILYKRSDLFERKDLYKNGIKFNVKSNEPSENALDNFAKKLIEIVDKEEKSNAKK